MARYLTNAPDGTQLTVTAADPQQAKRIAARRLRTRTAGRELRQKRRDQLTGSTISLHNTIHPDSGFDQAGGRWVTFCEEHGNLCNHPRLQDARGFLAAPWMWCERCAEICDS
jgi:hypothetical protein